MYGCMSGHRSSTFSLIQKRQTFHVKSTHYEFLMYSKLLFSKFQLVDSYHMSEADHLSCDLAFSPNGRIITSGGYHGDVCGYDSITGKQTFQKDDAHLDIVNEVSYISDDQFATASSDRTSKLWDVRKMSLPVLSFVGFRGPVRSVAFDEENSRLLTTSMDGSIRWWNVRGNTEQEDSLLLKCPDLTISSYSAKHNVLVFCTTSMMFVIKNVDLKHVYKDMKSLWERGVFTPDFREHGMWVSVIQNRERNSVTSFSNIECTPIPNSKTTGFNSLAIHPTRQAMVAAISTQQDLFGSASEYIIMYDTSKNSNKSDIECLFSAGDEITHHKLRYYLPIKRFRRSEVPSEVVDRKKKFDVSACGRVIAASNVNKVILLSTSQSVGEPFENVRNEVPTTALGLLETISYNGPHELHSVCELPITEGTVPICCKFSPRDMLLAVNGSGGQLTLYQPRL